MLHKELGKVEHFFIMVHNGELFVTIQALIWQQLMFFADLSIQDLELLIGQVLEAFHIVDN